MISLPSVEQFRGCLLGLALGDALGAGVEAAPPAIASEYAARLTRGSVPDPGPKGWVFGQVTDDTQLSRVLLQSISDAGQLDPAHFAAHLLALVRSGRLVGGGPATHWTAKQLALGLPWHQCAIPAPYAGNGAAMRAGPLGLLYRDDVARLTRVALEQGSVTHQDSSALAGAVAMAHAVALASQGEPIVPGQFLEQIAAVTEPVDRGFAGMLRRLGSWTHLAPAALTVELTREGVEPHATPEWQGVSSFVTSSVCWSLYAFLRHPDDWWEATRVAMAVGGDTDTMASMTGAISGARLGDGVLPARLLAEVNDHGERLAGPLGGLAERLLLVAEMSSRAKRGIPDLP